MTDGEKIHRLAVYRLALRALADEGDIDAMSLTQDPTREGEIRRHGFVRDTIQNSPFHRWPALGDRVRARVVMNALER